MKKNCHNCVYLDYYESYHGETGNSGFVCNKRETKDGSEKKLLDALSSLEYRLKSKVCHVSPVEISEAEKALHRIVERINLSEDKERFLDFSAKLIFDNIDQKIRHNKGQQNMFTGSTVKDANKYNGENKFGN